MNTITTRTLTFRLQSGQIFNGPQNSEVRRDKAALSSGCRSEGVAPALATLHLDEWLLWVKNGYGGGSTGTSPVPPKADHFVRRASRQGGPCADLGFRLLVTD
jgi:hypothetical protein